MISVIVPTLWKGQHYKKMLPILNSHPLIGEIIVVDNDTSNTDDAIHELNKLMYIPQKENIYVNPAWNLGVASAKFDKICLYSDDVLFDEKVVDAVYQFLTPENGIIGFALDSISESDEPAYKAQWETQNQRILPTFSFHYKFGICMFMHKESYHPIPSEFKIYYGDTYLFDKNLLNEKQNFSIENYNCFTKMKTSSKYFNPIIEEDNRHYKATNPSEGLFIDFMQDIEGYIKSLNT
jgi:GT2 family glycosyltransferase